MQLKALVAALALAAAGTAATAADYSIGNLSDLGSYSENSGTFAAGATISDNWYFSIGPLPADFSGLVGSVFTYTTGFIDDFTVSLSGPDGYSVAWDTFSSGDRRGFQWSPGDDFLASGDYQLAVSGVARGVTTYSVNFTAAPIPEPETYALMLAGLGVVGYMARRRRKG